MPLSSSNKGSSMAYEHFNLYYDQLMDDVPYERYLQLVEKYSQKNDKLLDLGCGTGTILVPLKQKGYDIEGLDISDEMLLITQNKLMELHLNCPLFQDDMRHIHRGNYYNLIFSFLDTINYLTSFDALKETFTGIYHSLKEEGVFLFDIHVKEHVEAVFQDYFYHADFEDFTYLWDTDLEQVRDATNLYHHLSFFIPNQEGLYERVDEEHHQVIYPLKTYIDFLHEVGFKSIDVLEDFEAKQVNPQKYIVICKKY
jgi:SAM-dependent methyltransferase